VVFRRIFRVESSVSDWSRIRAPAPVYAFRFFPTAIPSARARPETEARVRPSFSAISG